MHKKLTIFALAFLSSIQADTSIASKQVTQLQAAVPAAKILSPTTAKAPLQNPHTQASLKTAPTKRVVSITNNIKPEMLIKKHWSGDKVPDPFAILVNGKPLEPGNTATAALEDDTLKLQFNYSFMMGYRKGTNEVTFNVPEKHNKLAMTFDWENDFRIILDNAKPLKKEAIENVKS